MKKQLHYFILSIFALGLFAVAADAQTKRPAAVKPQTAAKFGGVYAGTELVYGINGMDIRTYTYYFRPDGTFATEFDEPDWRTRVNGTYTIKGKTITALINGDREPDIFEIEPDGDLKKGGAVLQRFPFANSVPAKRLENKSAGSSGGIATGGAVPYVGVFSNRVFIFDGRGNFSNDDQSSTVVSGENIGGGTTNKKQGGGTYTIKDSVLTLKYPDGTTLTKSFFYNPGEAGDELAAVIDGRFYFEYKDDDDEKPTAAAPEKKKQPPKETSAAPDAMSVLKAANRVHGGAKLDNLKSLRLTGKLTGADGAINHDFVVIYDFVRQKVRNEFAQNKKIDTVEQLDGTASFSWIKGQKTPLPDHRAAEMKQGLLTGIFGLRSDVLKSVKVTSITVNEEKNLKTIRVTIGGKEYGWLFDHENRLIMEASTENNQQRLDLSEDFRTIDGILLPFSNVSQLGALILELNLTSAEVNPNLTEKDWAIPR